MRDGSLEARQLERILEVGRQLVSELDLEAVLGQVLEAARELTGARYAALGVLDDDKVELERFVFTGIDESTRELIGALPRGHGILGELIRNPEPLRLDDLGEHPRSYGFPPNHPPMTTFLGVPVMIRGEVFGNLYLTEKVSEETFTAEDERLLILLAQWAAIAIDNARNYERAEHRGAEAERAVRGLQANAALSRELGGESDPARVLELVAKRGRALLDARSCAILLSEQDGFVVADCAGELATEIRGQALPARGSPAMEVLHAGTGQRLAERGMDWFRSVGIEAETSVIAPLHARGLVDGVIAALDPAEGRSSFSADDVVLLSSFATAAASAIASSRSLEAEKLELSIASSEQERRRWARELHDETLQELGALRVLQDSALRRDAEGQGRALAQASEQVQRIIAALEGLITELRPAALDQLGVQPAIENLIDRVRHRNDLRVEIDFDLAPEAGRLAPDIEATIYRVVQEGLNNVVKHAEADAARVAVIEQDGAVAVTVEDDGRGIGAVGKDRNGGGFGLLGMRERVELAGGEINIGPGVSGGTRLRVRLPAVHGS